ncbi:MAG TPA: AAA family ATPase [Planctomycetota bacterium]|nr:AAA family ATPase [Planctomycetota bacterium]
MNDDADIIPLREALKVSPDNVPLRRHLADALLRLGRDADAEAEYRDCLRRDARDAAASLGLARVFYRRGRFDEALVLIEGAVASPDAPGAAHLMHARILHRRGDPAGAVQAYRAAIRREPDCADRELAAELGVDANEREPVADGRIRAGGDAGEVDAGVLAPIERPKIDFASVGGMDELKEQIRLKIIHPIQRPDLYKAYGKKIGGGILLYGPPGCGKTHLARAVAGEIKAGFISIGINDVLEMWIGSSERNLHAIFASARANKPCVLFIDEVDALAASRSDMRQSAGRQAINQFLAELDGVGADNDGVLVLAATNAPWHIDSAFRRPGRFDRIVFVPPPDQSARVAILRVHLAGKPSTDLDLDAVAKKCDGFSGADLTAVVDRAVEGKLEQALKTNRIEAITTKDLLAAAKGLKATCKEWFASARNHALYANQGGLYDEVLAYLGIAR